MSAQSAYAAKLPPKPPFPANQATRWRRQSSQQHQPNSGGQRGSHSQAHSRDRAAGGGGGAGGSGSGAHTPTAAKQQQQHGVSSYAGNAWGGDKGKGGEGQRQQQGGQRAGAGAGGSAQQSLQEAHVPVRGFNAMETKEFLKKRSQAAHFGAGTSTIYKVQGDLGQRNSGPWGSKRKNRRSRYIPQLSDNAQANAMANGQDFWVQLRKQVGNLESGKAS